MIVGHIGGAGAPYEIQKSLRFRASASAYLSRTPTVAGNRKTWTWSGWVKRGALANGHIFTFDFPKTGGGGGYTRLVFSTDALRFESYTDGVGTQSDVQTSAVFRDPSAHFHVVLAVDTTQATAADRVVLYVNGARQTVSITTQIGQNVDTRANLNAASHQFGRYPGLDGASPSGYFDGYLSEINFIDGQALNPSYFGQVSAETGAWIPKKYTGTYGTNGFYLPFNDGSILANLAADRSGNGNNWTANNISLTAGATYDWMDDTPTNNFAVLNPLYVRGTAAVLSSANLSFQTQGSSQCETSGSHALPDSGKFYWEYVVTSMPTSRSMVGVGLPYVGTNIFTDSTNGCGYYSLDGKCYTGNVAQFTGATYTVNDVIGVAVDRDTGTVAFYKNNSLQGTASFNVSGALPMLCDTDATAGVHVGGYINFGQRPFAYSPPAGFKALCTKNLPTPSILNPKKHFDVKTWIGADSGVSRAFSDLQFPPDFISVKSRSAAYSHAIYDKVRGAGNTKMLCSNLTNAEGSNEAQKGYLSSFDSNGFTFTRGTDGATTNPDGYAYYDELNSAYVAWLWKAGGAPVTNNAGSIQSQVSANPQAGFSIVTYTGTGANATVGHGLGVAPKMVIVKRRSSTDAWTVSHASLSGGTHVLLLNTTDAAYTPTTLSFSGFPSSSVINLATNTAVNAASSTYVAYCFAEIPGYSKIGSYTGNGSADGPFVYCGFRPRLVMWKRTNAVGSWIVVDTARDVSNVSANYLVPNSSGAEASLALIDVTANGFKFRDGTAGNNGNGDTHVFMAFAEQPFQFANAR